MSLDVQFITMFMMFASGICLGIVFDVYRVLCGQLRIHRWLVSLFDLVYWIVGTLFVFRVLYLSNQGQLRMFVFIGLFIGLWVYFFLFSSTMIKIILWVIALIKKIVKICIRLFELFIVTPIMALYRLVTIILGFLAAVSIFIYKVVLQLLYPLWIIVKRIAVMTAGRIGIPGWLKALFDKIKRGIKRLF